MGCNSCGGGSPVPPDPNRGVVGAWTLRWPHGPLQKFPSKERAEAFAAARPTKHFVLLPPADEDAPEDTPET